jgi:dimethylaniline monooxygenase (N-oxide forming)
MDKYLCSYAKHFFLAPRARLNTLVHRAEWSEKKGKWVIESSKGDEPRVTEDFDKVVYSLGPDQIPNIPSVPGMEKFKGDVVHSIAFKK